MKYLASIKIPSIIRKHLYHYSNENYTRYERNTRNETIGSAENLIDLLIQQDRFDKVESLIARIRNRF